MPDTSSLTRDFRPDDVARFSCYAASSRELAIVSAIDRSGIGLEIGPSHNPLAPKSAGFNVDVLDHASADELREKYASHHVDIGRIEDVDYIWNGEPLHELIGREGFYDWIIASHVIEHVPDLVGFLAQCERLLKADGVLALVVPDKRYCFDAFQSLTSTGDILDAHSQQRTRPSAGKVFDHYANAAWLSPGGAIAWDPAERTELALVHDFEQAKSQWAAAENSTTYVDIHNWRFTPTSFLLILDDLRRCGLIRLGAMSMPTRSGCEFYSVLGQRGTLLPQDRLELLARMRAETT